MVVAPLDRAVARFPDALVPRFNLIRILLHFGDGEAVGRGLALLDDTLRRPGDVWRIDPLDDVLPWDFCSSFFDYRRYFDAVGMVLGGDAARARDLPSIIRAALCCYRASHGGHGAALDDRIADAAEASAIGPDFVEYGLLWCRLLLERGREADHTEAAAQLRRLAERSARVLEIVDLARGLPPSLRGGWLDEEVRLARRFWHAIELRETGAEPPLHMAPAGPGQRASP
jgi:hypothetical protein